MSWPTPKPSRALPSSSRQILDQLGRPGLLHQLVEGAVARVLVLAPAQQKGAVAEAVLRRMVVAHLGDQDRLQRLPLLGAFVAPARWRARRLAGEARRLD